MTTPVIVQASVDGFAAEAKKLAYAGAALVAGFYAARWLLGSSADRFRQNAKVRPRLSVLPPNLTPEELVEFDRFLDLNHELATCASHPTLGPFVTVYALNSMQRKQAWRRMRGQPEAAFGAISRQGADYLREVCAKLVERADEGRPFYVGAGVYRAFSSNRWPAQRAHVAKAVLDAFVDGYAGVDIASKRPPGAYIGSPLTWSQRRRTVAVFTSYLITPTRMRAYQNLWARTITAEEAAASAL